MISVASFIRPVVCALALLACPARAEIVDKVHDGDTLTLADGRKVRLGGIDAPELHQRCEGSNGRPWACGALAGEHLRRMAQGKDRYGRTIATCWVGGVDLGRAMVRDGFAVAYRRYSRTYLAEEGEACRRRRGVWSGSLVEPEAWRRRHGKPVLSAATSCGS